MASGTNGICCRGACAHGGEQFCYNRSGMRKNFGFGAEPERIRLLACFDSSSVRSRGKRERKRALFGFDRMPFRLCHSTHCGNEGESGCGFTDSCVPSDAPERRERTVTSGKG